MKYNKPFDQTDLNAPYVNGNPTIGLRGSIPPAAAIEYPQREIVHVIEAAGMIPTDSDLYQLLKAIKLFGGNIKYGVDTGTKNAVVVELDPAPTSYSRLFCVFQKMGTTNDEAMTFNANALGDKALKDLAGGALSSGAIVGGGVYIAMYDGSQMRILGGATSYTSISGLSANGGEVIDAPVVSGVMTINVNYDKPTHNTAFHVDDIMVRKIHGGGAHVKFTLGEFIDWVEGIIDFPAADLPLYRDTDGHYKINSATTTARGVVRKATPAEVAAGVAVTDKPYVGPEDINASAYGIGSIWSMKHFNTNGYSSIANTAGLAALGGIGYVTGAQIKAIMAAAMYSGYAGGEAAFIGPLDLAAIDNAWRFKVLFQGTVESYVPGYVGDVGPTRVYSAIVDLRRIAA